MGQLAGSGYKLTARPPQADIIIINTCAFIDEARKETEKVVRQMARYKKKGKCKKLYLAGCYPEFRSQITEHRTQGTGIFKLVDGIIDSIKLYSCRYPRVKATPFWTAYVKISEGCNNRCSYCLIPHLRGRLRHRKAADILNEVRGLAKRGAKEIIYVAQDTTAYPGFPKLLKRTAKIKGLKLIRVMYAHPSHVTKELLETIKKEKKIVKYLDLPIQHCRDKILRSMNRPYTAQKLTDLISEIRRRIPDITLRTSLIVGFPQETEADFKELYSFVRDVKFERLGAFPYSKEFGTPAAKLRGQVPEKIKMARFHELMRLQNRISREKNKAMLGKIIEVLIEGRRGRRFIGRTPFDAPEIDGSVQIKSHSRLKAGEIVKARVTSARAYDLLGRLIT